MLGGKLELTGIDMNRENYKVKRNKPKRDSTVSRSKIQMLAKPPALHTTSKMREIYATKTEWATNVLPKLKEK
jgi:hypothetical protein